MAWTTPGTATAGEVLTASFWNTNVRDNLNQLRSFANVQSTCLTSVVTASIGTTYADIAGFSVTITPQFSDSKILILTNFTNTSVVGVSVIHYRLVRGTTAISVGDAAGSRVPASVSIQDGGGGEAGSASIAFLDSPATTSATTYKVQWRTGTAGSATAIFNRSTTDTDNAGFGRYASNITAIEIPS